MDYNYRTRSGSPYDSHVYRPATSSAPSSHPMYGPSSPSSMYPRVGQPGQTAAPPPYAHSGRPLPHHQTTTPSSSYSSSGLGIRVTIKPQYRITPPGSLADPIVSKYIASGLSREAVPLAVANYGDNPTKVREFAKSFTRLREMGFASNDVAEALIMYENDTEKAVAHFLNSSS